MTWRELNAIIAGAIVGYGYCRWHHITAGWSLLSFIATPVFMRALGMLPAVAADALIGTIGKRWPERRVVVAGTLLQLAINLTVAFAFVHFGLTAAGATRR